MNKRIGIIGAGLGGLSAGIRLARMGFQVEIFEKNASIGGKMNELRLGQYRFDTGPSLLTMPFVVDDLFRFAGTSRSEYLKFDYIDPICRYFWEDGSKLDAHSDVERMFSGHTEFSESDKNELKNYLEYSSKIYELTAQLFLGTPIHEMKVSDYLKELTKLLHIKKIDPFRTVHSANSAFFKNRKLVQLFDRYTTYNGSNPFQAPATLNIIPHVEFGLGGFYVQSGMYQLVQKMFELAENLGINTHLNITVDKIIHLKNKAVGLSINGQNEMFDYIISNADVVNTYTDLIDGNPSKTRALQKQEPSLSGMIFFWGINKKSTELAHHNILFSENYQHEFNQIFKDATVPDDPTVYVSITSKSTPEDAPDNSENWFVLLNMPYLQKEMDWSNLAEQMKVKVFKKLRSAGIDIESNIEQEEIWTPLDLFNRYGSNRGSIYGISSNSKLAAFRRHANRDRKIEGLFFAGGSVHPGGGIPLVLLSGKMAADLISEKAGVNMSKYKSSNNTELYHNSYLMSENNFASNSLEN